VHRPVDTQGTEDFHGRPEERRRRVGIDREGNAPGCNPARPDHGPLRFDVRTSVVRGDGSAKDAVDRLHAALRRIDREVAAQDADNYSAMIDAIAPEIEVEKITEPTQKEADHMSTEPAKPKEDSWRRTTRRRRRDGYPPGKHPMPSKGTGN
jgi:hypothetical protein